MWFIVYSSSSSSSYPRARNSSRTLAYSARRVRSSLSTWVCSTKYSSNSWSVHVPWSISNRMHQLTLFKRSRRSDIPIPSTFVFVPSEGLTVPEKPLLIALIYSTKGVIFSLICTGQKHIQTKKNKQFKDLLRSIVSLSLTRAYSTC